MANHVRARRKELGLTQEKVAQTIGTTKATVMKLEKGMMQLTESWLNKLSIPLKCKPEDLIAATMPQDVPIVGHIKPKGEIAYLLDLPAPGAGEPDPQAFASLEKVERPPESGHRHIMALEVQSDALEPFLSPGSHVYYGEAKQEDFDALLNKMVVCQTRAGETLIRHLQPADNFGAFNLASPNGPVLENVELDWCAPVIFLKP
jgi:DNA-binding XRE family transcriptional regulator